MISLDPAPSSSLKCESFGTCFDPRQFQPQIMANKKQGDELKVNATPTFFVGNQMLAPGLVPYDMFKKVVDSLNLIAKKTPPAKSPGDSAKKTIVNIKGRS